MPMRTSNASKLVYSAVSDLVSAGKEAHRETIAEVTGLRQVVVDNHLRALKNDGRLQLVMRGVYKPVPPEREDRAISGTLLPEGGVYKLEIGDSVMELTMREARHAAYLLGGVAMHFGNAGTR